MIDTVGIEGDSGHLLNRLGGGHRPIDAELLEQAVGPFKQTSIALGLGAGEILLGPCQCNG
jgi:hypothetical protein